MTEYFFLFFFFDIINNGILKIYLFLISITCQSLLQELKIYQIINQTKIPGSVGLYKPAFQRGAKEDTNIEAGNALFTWPCNTYFRFFQATISTPTTELTLQLVVSHKPHSNKGVCGSVKKLNLQTLKFEFQKDFYILQNIVSFQSFDSKQKKTRSVLSLSLIEQAVYSTKS